MKNLIFALLLLMASTIASAQTKPDVKPAEKPDTTKQQPLFVAVFNQSEIADFLNFLNNIDLYSDKGRDTYIQMFKRKVTVLPPPPADKSKK